MFYSFQTGRSHILLVTQTPGKDQGAIGVVTLEDVVEVRAIPYTDVINQMVVADLQELIGKEIIVSLMLIFLTLNHSR